jgi:hypothetical protein
MLKRAWDGATKFLIINITSRTQNVLVKLIHFLMYLLAGTKYFPAINTLLYISNITTHSLNHFVVEMLKLSYGKW